MRASFSLVLGRSFVIHHANGSAPRVACANILPLDAVDATLSFHVNDHFYEPLFASELAKMLHVQSRDVVFVKARRHSVFCVTVNFAIRGPNAARLVEMLRSYPLGKYSYDSQCSEPKAVGNMGDPPTYWTYDEVTSGSEAKAINRILFLAAFLLFLPHILQ